MYQPNEWRGFLVLGGMTIGWSSHAAAIFVSTNETRRQLPTGDCFGEH